MRHSRVDQGVAAARLEVSIGETQGVPYTMVILELDIGGDGLARDFARKVWVGLDETEHHRIERGGGTENVSRASRVF